MCVSSEGDLYGQWGSGHDSGAQLLGYGGVGGGDGFGTAGWVARSTGSGKQGLLEAHYPRCWWWFFSVP